MWRYPTSGPSIRDYEHCKWGTSALTPRVGDSRIRGPAMILVILLIVLAIASGALGVIIKGAFWLFILTVLFLVGAFFVGRASRN